MIIKHEVSKIIFMLGKCTNVTNIIPDMATSNNMYINVFSLVSYTFVFLAGLFSLFQFV